MLILIVSKECHAAGVAAILESGEVVCRILVHCEAGRKIKKSSFFVSRKQNFFRPSVIMRIAMNKFVQLLSRSESIGPMSPILHFKLGQNRKRNLQPTDKLKIQRLAQIVARLAEIVARLNHLL
jgi:hypothetical protein